MPGVLVDNDVVLKVSAYDLVGAFLKITTCKSELPSMLGVGRYVIRDRIKRSVRIADKAKAAAVFESVLAAILCLEPNEEEMLFAAELEAAAAKSNQALDTGESQLVAILLRRGAQILLTGDKRAIKAIGAVVGSTIEGRVACLEQLMTAIVENIGVDGPRAAVSQERSVDKAITICFQCARETAPTVGEIFDALRSYVEDLRCNASGALLPGQSLSTLAF